MNRGFFFLVKVCLLLTVVLAVLSAYIRLSHAGLGCGDWPDCYGRIGEYTPAPPPTAIVDSAEAYRQLTAQAHAPMAWTQPTHRLVAGVLGLLVLVINFMAFARRDRSLPRLIPLLLLGLTAYLAAIGIWSGSLHHPTIVLGNLFGGIAMLALCWLLVLKGRPVQHPSSSNALRPLAGLALLTVGLQILLGGLTSANFAALACVTFPDCQGAWWPDAHLFRALDIFRALRVNELGVVVGGNELQAIHIAHRLGAWLTLLVVGWAGIRAIRAGGELVATGVVLLVLLLAEVGIGIAAVLTSLPVALSTTHNGLAALLLLSVMTLFWRTGRS